MEYLKYFLFPENLGKRLTESGHRVAVLAVDPSSGSTGGKYLLSFLSSSILNPEFKNLLITDQVPGCLNARTADTHKDTVI